jgi:tetratricopeptide (TPR) repeat protein
MRRSVVGTLALLPLLQAAELPAVQAQHAGSQQPEGRLSYGDDLHRRLRPLEALEVFEEILASDSTSYEALWKSAREAVSLGMLAADSDDQERRYAQAESFARTAIRVNPADAQGHHWLAVALGRQALNEGPRTKVRLAGEIRREALAALAIDSLHAGAHHVMGQWHAEVMRLSGFSRFVARRLLGADAFEEASWDEARRQLERATQLAPGMLIHHLELARIYLDSGHPDGAREEVRTVLERPAIEPTDALHKQEALELLRRIQ